jgi:3-hydroxyisobutyrate dehydrogenase-like beta-hydroxyacid dehydrogenase
MSSLRIGFIGIGNMGILMARKIVKNGEPLIVYDLRKEAVSDMVSLGATGAGSPREVAANSDVIFSMVRDETQNDEVIFGSDGVWQGIREGSTLVISSTISPGYCRILYARGKERGVNVIDAPVSAESRNFTPGQESVELTLMIGGDQETVTLCMPAFKAVGKNIFYLGPIGSGQTCKLINNLQSYGDEIFARECFNIGLKAGLDFEQMVAAVKVSTGFSKGVNILVRRLQRAQTAKPSTEKVQIKSIDEKDRDTALALAEEVGADTPITDLMARLDLKKIYSGFDRVSFKKEG